MLVSTDFQILVITDQSKTHNSLILLHLSETRHWVASNRKCIVLSFMCLTLGPLEREVF